MRQKFAFASSNCAFAALPWLLCRYVADKANSRTSFFTDQPLFLNIIVQAESTLASNVMLERAHAIEDAFDAVPGLLGHLSGGAGAGRNLPQAIAVGVALLVVGIVCFALGAVATTLLIAVILTLCAVEVFNTLRAAGYNPASLLGVVAVPSFAVAASADPSYGYPIVIGLTVVASMIWFLWVHPGPGAVGNLGVTLLGVAWIGGLGSFGTLMLGIGRVAEDAEKLKSNPGIGVLWAVVLVTVCYDVGAYFIGRTFGHTPLSAASPNKTVEGLIGGFATALFVPFLILMFVGGGVHPIGTEFARAFPFCLFCAIAAPAGDLCESALKRDLDVKDMGSLLPGHGGVLDRFDGFLFVLPTAWVMAHLLQVSPF